MAVEAAGEIKLQQYGQRDRGGYVTLTDDFVNHHRRRPQFLEHRAARALPQLDFRVAGFAKIRFRAGKSELLRVQLQCANPNF